MEKKESLELVIHTYDKIKDSDLFPVHPFLYWIYFCLVWFWSFLGISLSGLSLISRSNVINIFEIIREDISSLTTGKFLVYSL